MDKRINRPKEKKFMKLIMATEMRIEINKLVYKPDIMIKYLPYLNNE